MFIEHKEQDSYVIYVEIKNESHARIRSLSMPNIAMYDLMSYFRCIGPTTGNEFRFLAVSWHTPYGHALSN